VSDNELHQIILSRLTDLSSKLDKLQETVYNLNVEVAVLKRDRQWGKYIAGIIGSVATLFISFILNR
jgi:hypothetical protein